jgi:hypothetical protein
MRKIVSIISVLMLLLCLIPAFQFAVLADNEDPNPEGKIYGPWTITVPKSYKDRTIEVGGNLTIKSGGNLKLDNVKLIMNSTPSEEFFITVEPGGTLQVLNGSLVTNNATYDKPYFLTVNQGAQATVTNSELRRMGNSSATIAIGNTGRMGLLVQSTNTHIQDSVIADSFAGTICMNLLPITPTIVNTTYRNNTMGFAVSMGCTPVMHDNVYIKNAAGFAVVFKPQGQTGLAHDRFYNNTIAVAATMSPLGLNDIIIENSTEAGIGAMAGSALDVSNVMLKNNKNATVMDNSTMLLRDSVVTGSGTWDFFVNNVSMVKVLNCTIDDRTGIKVNDTKSLLELQWYLNVATEYMAGGIVAGAIINVTDASGALAYSTATNGTGSTGGFIVSELRDAGNGAVALTPHNVTAEKGAFWNKSLVTIDHTQSILLKLWERDLVMPMVGIASPAEGAFLNSSTVVRQPDIAQ